MKKKVRADSLADYCILPSPESGVIVPSGQGVPAPSEVPFLSSWEYLSLADSSALARVRSHIGTRFIELPENLISHVVNPLQMQSARFREALSFYANSLWRGNPATFFSQARAPLALNQRPIHGLRDGEVVDCTFRSAYRGHHPDWKALNEQHPQNGLCHLRWWRHQKNPRATVVALYGWAMERSAMQALALGPGELYRAGFDVIAVELPFHGRRGDSDARTLFPSVDLVRSNEAFGQAIHDTRRVIEYVEMEGRAPVGVVGVSLGGYLALLTAALQELSFCVALVAPTELGEVAWKLIRQSDRVDGWRAVGVTQALLTEGFALHSPRNFDPRTNPRRILMVSGRGDAVVPTKQTQALAKRWPGVTVRWAKGGHAAPFLGGRLLQETVSFLKKLS